MEPLLGAFSASTGRDANSRWFCVFDDALVELKAVPHLGIWMGDFVGYRLQVGFLRRKRAAVEALGPAATSTEVAEKIRGAKRIPLSGIDTAELKVFDGGSQSAKELGVEGSGLLTIRTSAGEELLWFVRGDAAELGSILSNLLGTRLTRN